VHAFYAWLRRHPKLVDGVLAALLVLIGGSAFHASIRTGENTLVWALVTVLFIFGMAVPVVLRRRYPTGAFAAVIAIGALEVAVLPRPVGSDFSVLVLLYTLAAYRPRRVSALGLAICLLGATVAIARWEPGRTLDSLSNLGIVAAFFSAPLLLAWVLGDSIRYRRGYYLALEERAARLERERDAQAQIAAAAERARIARELHDVVAHNVSVMVVQADGAGYALSSDPERAREALGAISRTGRQALAEMRRLLGVLRAEDEPATLAPLPDIDQLGELLEATRASGIPVRFTLEGVPRTLPGGAGLAAYRVIQESLTNVRKHAGPEASASVLLRFCEEGVLVRVTDDGHGSAAASDGEGHGLTGMRERVGLYGGTVQAGPRPAGGYQVTVQLPYAVPAVLPDSGRSDADARPRAVETRGAA
jgi:signal transduction histidine kinase